MRTTSDAANAHGRRQAAPWDDNVRSSREARRVGPGPRACCPREQSRADGRSSFTGLRPRRAGCPRLQAVLHAAAECLRHARVAAALAAVLAGGHFLAPMAWAQQPPPGPVSGATLVPVAETAAALQRIAAELAAQRAPLDEQRHRLREERMRLSAVDQPASPEQIDEWSERHAAGTRIGARVEMLHGLVAALTPETLAAIPAPTAGGYEFEVSGAGLAESTVEVNVRDAPDGAPTIVLPAGTLVVVVAADRSGQWSVVVAADGAGFVPTSMLKNAE